MMTVSSVYLNIKSRVNLYNVRPKANTYNIALAPELLYYSVRFISIIYKANKCVCFSSYIMQDIETNRKYNFTVTHYRLDSVLVSTLQPVIIPRMHCLRKKCKKNHCKKEFVFSL